jgi:SAM-dependent methyltransferase
MNDTSAPSSPEADGAPSPGQRGIEQHVAAWFENLENDFRATSLNQLIAGLVKPGRVLDIGCGSGGLSAELLTRGFTVTSQDISEEMVSMCRRYLTRRGFAVDKVRRGGVDDIPEAGAFDTVTALDVIEHIEDDRGALLRMREALKPDGRLVLSVPALSWLYGPKDKEVGHYRRYDKEALVQALEGAGFTVERIRFWNGIGVLPVWLSLKRGKRLNEDFRYGGRSPVKRALNTTLRLWFTHIENSVPAPRGLSLIACARLSAAPRPDSQ